MVLPEYLQDLAGQEQRVSLMSPTAHFIAMADPTFRFSDVSTICDKYGYIVFACDDSQFAGALIELFYLNEQGSHSPLTVVAASTLSRPQRALAASEIDRAESIGSNLDSEYYCTKDQTCAEIGRVAIKLGMYAVELENTPQLSTEVESDLSRLPTAITEYVGEAPDEMATTIAEGNSKGITNKLQPSQEKAYKQYLEAVKKNPNLSGETDKSVYDWIDENILDEDETLPKSETWQRQLRTARKYNGTQKNRSRAGRETGKSVVRRNEIE